MPIAKAGSQHWMQVAVNRRGDLLLDALRRAGAISASATVRWASPLEAEDCCEPVWDAIGRTSDDVAVFVEAKAHIPEAASPASRASPASLELISRSLEEARRWYAPKAGAAWSGLFYQYANRLAHHYLIEMVNRVPSVLVFLYFVNATEMRGPASEAEWRGATQLLHAALGLPPHLESLGVFDAFLDVRQLERAA
jgi:hypothetical protein